MAEKRRSKERGAAAVEFALVVPILLILIMGIIEFSRIYNAQILVTNAARASARTMAVTNNSGQATSAAQTAASPYTVSVAVGSCVAGTQVQSTVTTNLRLISGSWLNLGPTITLRGVGAMRCLG